ncbi:MAG: rod shape-determining protein RodA [Candidatus Omnitrophica bacterium]|nr:rod shape-determining protein RodA [Candidatus Omnitrophota bacterium]
MRNSFLKTAALALLISIIGITCIYSSSHKSQDKFWEGISGKQTLWVILSFIAFIGTSRLNYRRLWDWIYFFYVVILFLLLLVFILGTIRSGAQRWLKFFWFNFQPSEFAKLITVIFLAKYYSRKSAHDISPLSFEFGIFRGLVLPFIFIAFPVAMILQQPDLGSASLLVLTFFVILFVSGVKLRYIFVFMAIGLLCLPVVWHFLRDYQKERLIVFLDPNIDPLGAGYTIIQSKIAIGSGGFWGKGWLSGTQSQLNFLPESHTDFIFAAFSEQRGFLGAICLLTLYYVLSRQALSIGSRTNDDFAKLLSFGIASLLAIQVFVNIAMNLGFAPVVGIPLPLMSYGGSSMLTTFIALGILVSIDRRRAVF